MCADLLKLQEKVLKDRCGSGVLFTTPDRNLRGKRRIRSAGNASQQSEKDLFSKVVVFKKKK